MSVIMGNSNSRVLILVLAFTMIVLVPATRSVFADQQPITNTQSIELFVGGSIVVMSDRPSIQRTFLSGNLTAVSYAPDQYPTNEFAFTSMSLGVFTLRLFFDYPTGYKVRVQSSNQTTSSNILGRLLSGGQPKPQPANFTLLPGPGVSPLVKTTLSSSSSNSTTYYLSSGPSELDIDALFVGRPLSAGGLVQSPSIGFFSWTGSFGDAFPIWVKLLYFVLGVQFFIVGGLWIGRETEKRQSSSRSFDFGDKVYLWVDVACKFLLVSFVALGLMMGGEFLVVFLLRYMFLITINAVMLWNLFSLGFALGAVVIAYIVRFTLERGFDLRPMSDE